jgi:hypothetical protein
MPPAAAVEDGSGEGWASLELEHRGAGQSARGRGRSGWGAVQSMFSWSVQAHPSDA